MKLGSMTKFAFVSILMIGNIKPSAEVKHDGLDGAFTVANTQWKFGINGALADAMERIGTTAPHMGEDPFGEWKYEERWERESGDSGGGDSGGGGGGSGSGDNRTDAEIAADKALCEIEAKEENVKCVSGIETNVNDGMRVCNTASNFVEALAALDMAWAIPLFRQVSNCDGFKTALRKTSQVRCAASNRTSEEWCVYVNQP
jgi:hypothetical protein